MDHGTRLPEVERATAAVTNNLLEEEEEGRDVGQ